MHGDLSTRGIGVGVGPLRVSTSARGGARSIITSMIAFALAVLVITLVLVVLAVGGLVLGVTFAVPRTRPWSRRTCLALWRGIGGRRPKASDLQRSVGAGPRIDRQGSKRSVADPDARSRGRSPAAAVRGQRAGLTFNTTKPSSVPANQPESYASRWVSGVGYVGAPAAAAEPTSLHRPPVALPPENPAYSAKLAVMTDAELADECTARGVRGTSRADAIAKLIDAH